MLTNGNFTPASDFQNVDILFTCRNYRTFSTKIQENTGTKMSMVGFFILKRISKNIYNFIASDFMRISKNGLDPVIFFSTPSISSCQLAQISLLLFVSPYYYILTFCKSMRKMQTVLMKIQDPCLKYRKIDQKLPKYRKYRTAGIYVFVFYLIMPILTSIRESTEKIYIKNRVETQYSDF